MCPGSFPLNYCIKENKMSNLLIYCCFGLPSHLWKRCSWSLIRMKFSLIFISMPHAWIANWAISFWGWRTAHQVLPWSVKMQIHLLHFLEDQWHAAVTVLILYRENSKVMLAHEISFNIMVSEILSSLDFLPFSLPELTTSPTICCIAVASG